MLNTLTAIVINICIEHTSFPNPKFHLAVVAKSSLDLLSMHLSNSVESIVDLFCSTIPGFQYGEYVPLFFHSRKTYAIFPYPVVHLKSKVKNTDLFCEIKNNGFMLVLWDWFFVSELRYVVKFAIIYLALKVLQLCDDYYRQFPHVSFRIFFWKSYNITSSLV